MNIYQCSDPQTVRPALLAGPQTVPVLIAPVAIPAAESGRDCDCRRDCDRDCDCSCPAPCARGAAGLDGMRGPRGFPGPAGPQGVPGPRGIRGATGSAPSLNALHATNEFLQTPDAACASLSFSDHQVTSGRAIVHKPGEAVITLRGAGAYLLHYTTTVSGGADAVFPLTVRTRLQVNGGALLPGSVSEGTLTAAEQSLPLSACALYTAAAGDTLRLLAPSADVRFSNTSLVIQKLR